MVYYFSGTGNCKFIASIVAGETGQEIISLNQEIRNRQILHISKKETITFVLPTYAGRIPRAVEGCIRKTYIPSDLNVYFIVTCGETMGNADAYIKKLCAEKRINLQGVKEILMPMGYIPMFTAPGDSQAVQIIQAGKEAAVMAAQDIKDKEPFPEQKTKWSAMSHLINPVFYQFMIKTKDFYATDACIGCNTCGEACPFHNIQVKNGKPVWGNSCTHCMACVSSRPRQAIEYGKKTVGKARYHCGNFIGGSTC